MHDNEMKIIVQTSSSKPFVILVKELSQSAKYLAKCFINNSQSLNWISFNDFSTHSKHEDSFHESEILCLSMVVKNLYDRVNLLFNPHMISDS